jgi:hypothetical protein
MGFLYLPHWCRNAHVKYPQKGILKIKYYGGIFRVLKKLNPEAISKLSFHPPKKKIENSTPPYNPFVLEGKK